MIQMLILMLIVFQIGCAQNQLSNDSGDTGGRAKYFEQNAVGIAASIYYHQEKFAGRPTKEIVEDYIYSYKKSYDDYVTSKKAFGEATNIYQKYETELSKLVWNSNQKYTYIASLDLRDTYDPSQRGYLLKNDSMQWINAPYRGTYKNQGYWYVKLKFDQGGLFAPYDPNRYRDILLMKRLPPTMALYTFVIKKIELATENTTKSLLCHTEIVSIAAFASDRYDQFKRDAEHAPFLLPAPEMTFKKP